MNKVTSRLLIISNKFMSKKLKRVKKDKSNDNLRGRLMNKATSPILIVVCLASQLNIEFNLTKTFLEDVDAQKTKVHLQITKTPPSVLHLIKNLDQTTKVIPEDEES